MVVDNNVTRQRFAPALQSEAGRVTESWLSVSNVGGGADSAVFAVSSTVSTANIVNTALTSNLQRCRCNACLTLRGGLRLSVRFVERKGHHHRRTHLEVPDVCIVVETAGSLAG